MKETWLSLPILMPTKNIGTPQEKDFRLGGHSSNKCHYLVMNTEGSQKANNIQLISLKFIRED